MVENKSDIPGMDKIYDLLQGVTSDTDKEINRSINSMKKTHDPKWQQSYATHVDKLQGIKAGLVEAYGYLIGDVASARWNKARRVKHVKRR
jgi:hypothetical protein